jgi:hypothetical protein
MSSRSKITLFLIFSLALTTIACSISAGGPAYPAKTIPLQTEEASKLFENWDSAAAGIVNHGKVTLTYTEAQVSSFVDMKLRSDPNSSLTNPQVYFQNGQLDAYTNFQTKSLTATLHAAVKAAVDSQGKLKLIIQSIDLGPMPMPGFLLDGLSYILTQSLTGSLSPYIAGLKLESITISDGQMVITGEIQK